MEQMVTMTQLSNAIQATQGVQFNMDILWTLIAAILVFFMQAGFAMVETGFVRAKNGGNVLMKNLMDFSMGALAFWAVGFGVMFGLNKAGLIGTSHFFLIPGSGENVSWMFTFFTFQLMFAATAATIVSGAMAGRTKFKSYLIYSFFVSFIIYPVSGHWAWGNLLIPENETWLTKLGYIDFAGSSVVHMVGGILALVGAIFLGPRIGKYRKNGKSRPIPGHNLPIAALGVFILWFGWYGFNAGSTVAAVPDIGLIALTTTLGAASATILALLTSWIVLKVPDIGMSFNGALAGLVAITAGCANVDPWAAVVIGAIAGVLVVLSVLFVDKVLKIDDPVGAFSVHGVNGLWGTLAAGIFANNLSDGVTRMQQVGVQALGILAIAAWAIVAGIILFGVIKKTVGLRVSREDELKGLDLSEHKADSYADFRKDFTKM